MAAIHTRLMRIRQVVAALLLAFPGGDSAHAAVARAGRHAEAGGDGGGGCRDADDCGCLAIVSGW